jgi:hypothetical protein
MGTIVASVVAGYLAATDIRLPFFMAAASMAVCLAAGMVVGGRFIRSRASTGHRLDAVPVP